MNKKLFDKTLPKKCEYCAHSFPLGDEGEMVCRKKGMVNIDDYCRKYKYDPLKREPRRQLISDNYSPEDFAL